MSIFKRLLIISLLLFVVGVFSFGQSVSTVGEPDAASIGVDTAQQQLKEVSVSKFEDSGFWSVSMGRDQGITTLRRLPGGPMDKEPIPDEEKIGLTENDKFVLGVRVDYYKRGFNQFVIRPAKPLPVEGIVKTMSVWVVGRNSPHTLKLLISDQFGNKAELTMGKLNFTGWKKMTVAVPSTIKQQDYHFANRTGLKVEGFRVECDPEETLGTYFFYLDDLRAVTDLFSEQNRDIDDMMDNW
ncbi:MAG: flagellar filament outer layer protein FlaA [Spirochaetales bacterium]|nr:flagellar filament outer layer protein FlaA [Spirochaetales bacterium]